MIHEPFDVSAAVRARYGSPQARTAAEMRRLRVAAGVRQSAVARHLGVSRQAVWQRENTSQPWSLEAVERFVGALVAARDQHDETLADRRARPPRSRSGRRPRPAVPNGVEADDWLPLVKWVMARRIPDHVYQRIDRDDVHQAGVVGLMNAVRLFDPAKGVQFKTYAVHKIRWAILIAAGLTSKGWEAIPARLPERFGEGP